MRNPQDTKNILLINKYVRDHFGLTDKSYSLFRHRVLYEPNIAPEYRSIIGDASDLRARFKLEETELENFDEGWKTFKSRYYEFIIAYDITYKNFVENKIEVNKNQVKIFKKLIEFYSESADRLASVFNSQGRYWLDFSSVISNAKKFFRNENDRIRSITYNPVDKSFYISINGIGDEYSVYSAIVPANKIVDLEALTPYLERGLKDDWNYIGAKALPKKGSFELVVSCNPADIFMASTSEKWGSCISLTSDYPEAYWGGLPGAIVDKNRAIAYITDGAKKKFFGIETDRFITRTFLLTGRDKSNKNQSFISTVREYPISVNLADILKNKIGEKYNFFQSPPSSRCVSRYFFETMIHDLGSIVYDKFCYIYLDNTKISFPRRNKVLFPMEYAYHKFNGGGYPDIAIKKPYILRGCVREQELYFEWSEGLNGLIQRDHQLEIDCSIVDEIRYA